MRKSIIPIVVVIAWLQPAFAATNYVATHTGGTYNGASWGTAYTNIQTAINASANNDFIFIKQGTYIHNTGHVIISNKVLTIRGGYIGSGTPGSYSSDASLTALDAGGNNRVLYIVNCTTGLLEGVTIRNGRLATAGNGAGVHMGNNSTFRFLNCRIRESRIYDGYGGGIYANGGKLILDKCQVRNNFNTSSSATGVPGGGVACVNGAVTLILNSMIGGNAGYSNGGGIYIDSTGSSRLFNCLIRDNTTDATWANPDGGGIYKKGTGPLSVENCTIIGNAVGGILQSDGTTVVTNSIVWDNGDDIIGTVTLAYSNVEDGDQAGSNGNISSDPLFVGGYYPGNGSPCTNSGGALASSLGLDTKYSLTNATDSGTVDLGYHHEAAFTSSHIYVTTNGNDSTGNGSSGNPYRSITKALGVAGEHARIHIGAGQYTNSVETFPLNLATDGVQLLGTNALLTIIDATNAVQRVLTVTDVGRGSVLSNLTFTGGYINTTTGYGAGLYLDHTSIRLYDCIIRNNRLQENNGIGVFLTGGSPLFERCKLANNIYYNTGSTKACLGGGIFQKLGNLAMQSCVISENKVKRGNAPGGGGVYIFENAGDARFFNCLIKNNSSVMHFSGHSALAGGVYVEGVLSRVNFENCTITGNSPEGIRRGSGIVFVTNSVVWNNGDDITGTVTVACSSIEDGDGAGQNGNISADPKFAMGYYLGTGTACINAGGSLASILGLNGKYARTNAMDSGTVDLGYHYESGFSISQADIYVGPGGDDIIGDGMLGNKYRSITKALSVAEEGARIHVEAGTYGNTVETFPIVLATEAVQILGTNAAATVVTASGSGKRVMTIVGVSSSSVVSNLTLRGGSGALEGGGLLIDHAGVKVVDCHIRDNTTNQKPGIGVYVDGGSPEFVGCKILNNTPVGTTGHSGGGLYKNRGNVTVRSCVIVSNRISSGQGGAICVDVPGELRVFNTLIATNTTLSAGKCGGIFASGNAVVVELANVTLADNIFSGIQQAGGAVVSIKNSILWHNSLDSTGTVSISWSDIGNSSGFTDLGGNTNVNPAFVDQVYYHLKSVEANYINGWFSGGSWSASATHSPLIDAGDTNSVYSLEPYYNGERINMGAYGNTPTASRSIPPPSGSVLTVL